MADHLDSKSLVPFNKHKNGYHLPGMAKEQDAQMIDQVDPDLRPDEQGYVRHYLAYADAMLASYKEEPEKPSSPQELTPEQNKTGIPEMQKNESQEKAVSEHTPAAAETTTVTENSNLVVSPVTPADDQAA